MSSTKACIEEMKAEAIARLELLKLSPEIVELFKDGEPSIHDPLEPYSRRLQSGDLKHIKEFEEEHNALVYAVIRKNTSMGMTDAYLFVDDYPPGWEHDRQSLLNSVTWAFVLNHREPEYSE